MLNSNIFGNMQSLVNNGAMEYCDARVKKIIIIMYVMYITTCTTCNDVCWIIYNRLLLKTGKYNHFINFWPLNTDLFFLCKLSHSSW